MSHGIFTFSLILISHQVGEAKTPRTFTIEEQSSSFGLIEHKEMRM